MNTRLPTAAKPTIALWRSDHESIAAYVCSITEKTHSNGRFNQAKPSRLSSSDLEKREESMGSSVNATNNEMITATEMVMPNWRKNWPTMPFTNAIGKNTATMVKVVARTLSATSLVPSSAA